MNLPDIISFFIHLDKHMITVVHDYGVWTYLILFLIIFCETGLVVTPFLPGDSLLFVVGALAATGALNIFGLIILLVIAAIGGNTLNYTIGRILAPKVFKNERIPFLKPEYLERTHKFFEKHGPKAIVLSRFMPILRTVAPFTAGVGNMGYKKFTYYNVFGGLLWVLTFVLAGYFFGNIPFIKKNFSFSIFIIIIISLLPGVWEYYKHKSQDKKA